jgi:hypothetical protein
MRRAAWLPLALMLPPVVQSLRLILQRRLPAVALLVRNSFGLNLDSNAVRLVGILWGGGNIDGRTTFFYSSIGSVEAELATLTSGASGFACT